MHGSFLPVGGAAPSASSEGESEYERVDDKTPVNAGGRSSRRSSGTVGSHHTYEGLPGEQQVGPRGDSDPLYEEAGPPRLSEAAMCGGLHAHLGDGDSARHIDSSLSSDAEEARRMWEGGSESEPEPMHAAGRPGGFYSAFGDRSLRDPDAQAPPVEVRRGDTLASREDGGWAASFIDRFK